VRGFVFAISFRMALSLGGGVHACVSVLFQFDCVPLEFVCVRCCVLCLWLCECDAVHGCVAGYRD